MARLLHAKYSQVAEFIKRLEATGLTAEQMITLTTEPEHMRQWVEWLENVHPSVAASRLLITDVLAEDLLLASSLRGEEIVTLGELADCTIDEVRSMRLIGDGRMKKIQAAFTEHGLRFSDNIDNGARRVYSSRRSWSCRRDRLGDKLIESFIEIRHGYRKADRAETSKLTIDHIRAMNDRTLREYYHPSEAKRIREWIAANVY